MAGKIKIFVDAHSFDKEYQGSRTFIRELYSALIPLSDDLDICFGARDIRNLAKELPLASSTNLIRYTSRNPVIRLGFEIPRIIRRYKFDYAHFQYITPLVKNCRYIVTTHDLLFNDFRQYFPAGYRQARNIFFRRSLEKADIKTTPSAYSRERIAFHYGIHPRKIHIIPNGVSDIFLLSAGDKQAARNYIREKYGVADFILCVSRIEPRKNHALLLQSFLELGLYKKGISLVFAGKESIRTGSLHRTLNGLPPEIRRYILHIRQAPADDLVSFYHACRVFVYPSLAEGAGIPPLEAAALGTPVLCSRATAMAGYDFFGNALFDPADKYELQEKLGNLLSDGTDNDSLQTVASVIRRKYSWEHSARKLLSLLTKDVAESNLYRYSADPYSIPYE